LAFEGINTAERINVEPGSRRKSESTRYNRNSAFSAKQSSRSIDVLSDMRKWCRGRWWQPRFAMLIWFGYMWVGMIRDPDYHVVFDAINLGIHELGHYLWMPFGEFMHFLGGSMTQCLAPLISVLLFYRQRDYFAMAFCFGWLSTSCYSLATYIADARAQALPLVTPGGGEPLHDWHYMLGRLGLLNQDQLLGSMTRGVGAVSMFIFLFVGGYQVWLMFISRGGDVTSLGEEEFEDEVMRSLGD
jgi:hypothetical protein